MFLKPPTISARQTYLEMEVLEPYSGLMKKTVVVKKLSEAKTHGHREFIAEMETLEKGKHQNLVPLIGYCSFDEENLLVYEYMVNAWGA